MKRNREMLASRFAQRLLELKPRSVLDVGAGAGPLLAACRERGVPATGIEPSEAKVEALVEAGHTAVQADARSLPFDDESFDWVAIRHVTHHLEDPAAALAEAWRVACTGLMVAEPYLDLSVETQRASARLDRLLRTAGQHLDPHHKDNLSSGELLELIPETPARVAVESFLSLRPMPMDDFESEVAEVAEGLSAEQRRELEVLREVVQSGAITLGGTVIVTAWKNGNG